MNLKWAESNGDHVFLVGRLPTRIARVRKNHFGRYWIEHFLPGLPVNAMRPTVSEAKATVEEQVKDWFELAGAADD